MLDCETICQRCLRCDHSIEGASNVTRTNMPVRSGGGDSSSLRLEPFYYHFLRPKFLCLSAVIAVALVGLIVECTLIFLDYTNHPTVTRIEIVRDGTEGLHLPEFAFCSPWQLNYTQMEVEHVPREVVELVHSHFRWANNLFMMTSGTMLESIEAVLAQSASTRPLNVDEAVDWLRRWTPPKGSRAVRVDDGDPFERFLLHFALDCDALFTQCMFGLSLFRCCEHIQPVLHDHYGVCYKTNSTKLGKQQWHTGVSIVLDTDPLNFRAGSNASRQSLKFRKPSFAGIIIEMGKTFEEATFQETRISRHTTAVMRLSAVKYELSAQRVGGCQEPLFDYWTTDKVRSACWASVVADEVCNCSLINWNSSASHKRHLCLPMEKEACYQRHWEKLKRSYWQCMKRSSQPLCVEWKYAHELITTPLDIDQTPIPMGGYNESRQLVHFQAHYSELSYTLIKELDKYSFHTFISNIGGQCGIWVGISLISLFEKLQDTWCHFYVWLRRS